MNKKTKFDFGKFVEERRFWIGGGLLLLILVCSGVLIWRENYGSPSYDDRISDLENRISGLENGREISNSKLQISNENSNDQNTNNQNTVESQGAVAGAATLSQGQVKSDKQQVAGKVNINTASASELDTLPGIGPVYAERIIEYRNANGGFKTPAEIKNIKGIGDKTYEKLKDSITVN